MLKHSLALTQRVLQFLRLQQGSKPQPDNGCVVELQITSPSTRHDDRNHPYEAMLSSSSSPGLSKRPSHWNIRFRSIGWRGGALNFALWSSLVFLVNLSLTIAAFTRHHEGKGILYTGGCDHVKRLNTGFHALINVLSTVLLAGSNYCMQCLSAPTRKEIDAAHAKGKWLDIGIPSMRNVRYIGWRRVLVWWLLALSSLPLHLFYNSAVYASVSSYSYFVFPVSHSFLNSSSCLNCEILPNTPFGSYLRSWGGDDNEDLRLRLYDPSQIPETLHTLWGENAYGKLEHLNSATCIDEYASSIQSKRRNLLLVASDNNFPSPFDNTFINGSYVFGSDYFDVESAASTKYAGEAYSWICSGLNHTKEDCSARVGEIKANIDSWRIGEYRTRNGSLTPIKWPVEYCLSQKAEPRCRLRFETSFAIIVTNLNILKAALMFYVALGVTEEPLMTMGDTVASFLTRRDPFTKNMCLASLHDFKQNTYYPGPQYYNLKKTRWKDVTSKKRRIVVISLFIACLITITAFFAAGIVDLSPSLKTLPGLARLGYGAVDPRTAINRVPNDVVSNAIMANIPQLLLSILYFSYNALFTAMQMGAEWASYTIKRAGLRVSSRPRGSQRTTYFLQLPYRYGLPLMMLSGLLHWLVSQSIFLLAVDYFDVVGNPGVSTAWGSSAAETKDFKTCGYSPIAILTVLIIGIAMVLGLVGVGFVEYRGGSVVVGSNSLAIAAACQPVEEVGEEVDAAFKKVMWGEMALREDGVGHCGFSASEVGRLINSAMYA